jgi:hypothetical protein
MRRAVPLLSALALSLAALPARAGDAPPSPPPAEPGVALTVYSSADPAGFDPQQFLAQQRQGGGPAWVWQVPGFGVVKEVREIPIAEGVSELPFTGVAEFIDPTTVSFADLTSPATSVLEQAFRFDLASPDKILDRYVGKTIAHETLKDGQVVARAEGTVLSVNQGTVVLDVKGQGLRFLTTRDPGLRLPALPEGLLTKPTLVWKVQSPQAGTHKVRTTYQTSGLTWRADYNLVLDASNTKADVSAWVTMLNVSGASYRDARLKLIAGDVQRVQPRGHREVEFSAGRLLEEDRAGFEEKAFFEYHLYTLPRPTSVLDQSTQQITLFPSASDVAVQKLLVYYGLPEAAHWGAFPEPRTDRDIRSGANPKLDVYVRFENRKENRMGMPLPRGKVRVFQRDDADGTLEFVGEDLIDHTPRDEKVLVKVGQAFDVVGDRVQTDFQLDTGRCTMTDAYKITLRNHKDTAVRVLVKENLFRWTTWEVSQTSDPFVKTDARTITFEVDVPPNGEKVVTYTARYTW